MKFIPGNGAVGKEDQEGADCPAIDDTFIKIGKRSQETPELSEIPRIGHVLEALSPLWAHPVAVGLEVDGEAKEGDLLLAYLDLVRTEPQSEVSALNQHIPPGMVESEISSN